MSAPLDITANLNDAFNNWGASTSSATIGNYRTGNTSNLNSSNFGLLKSALLFAGVYMIFKLLKRGK